MYRAALPDAIGGPGWHRSPFRRASIEERSRHDHRTDHRRQAALGPRSVGGRPAPLVHRVHHPSLGVSKVGVFFNHCDAEIVIGETLDTTTLTATVDVASIDTADADRDRNVLSPALFDVAKRPTMVFRSARVTGAGSEYRVDGELTIGEVTRPIVLATEFGSMESV